jgi:hypothetical protein
MGLFGYRKKKSYNSFINKDTIKEISKLFYVQETTIHFFAMVYKYSFKKSYYTEESSCFVQSHKVVLHLCMQAKKNIQSLPNEIAILKNLAKQEIVVSNRLVNQLGNFSKLPSFPSARAYMRARIDRAS